MSAVTIRQMAQRIADLMEKRLGVRGADLAAKLRRGARQLPRKLRAEAALLAEAAELSSNPKIALQLDEARLAQAYDALSRHLSPMGRGARRREMLRDMITSAVLSLFLAAGLFLAILIWRGFL